MFSGTGHDARVAEGWAEAAREAGGANATAARTSTALTRFRIRALPSKHGAQPLLRRTGGWGRSGWPPVDGTGPSRKLGAPGRARTYGLQIRSLALYPTELRARTLRNSNATIPGAKRDGKELGWVMGLEPTTPGATVQCSTIELHPPSLMLASLVGSLAPLRSSLRGVGDPPGPAVRFAPRLALSPSRRSASRLGGLSYSQPSGTPGGIRTPDMRLRRPPLYPSELLAHEASLPSVIGRGERIRTSDFLLPKQARYQTAPRPVETSNYRAVFPDGQREGPSRRSTRYSLSIAIAFPRWLTRFFSSEDSSAMVFERGG